MSIKRILGITVFGVLFIAAVIGVMFLMSYFRRDNDAIPLPGNQSSPEPSGLAQSDALNRIVAAPDTIQAIISTLSRPDIYSRDVLIETFWEDGHAKYHISTSVADGATSLRILPSAGSEKRIIIFADMLYIWYRGDSTPYIGVIGSPGDRHRNADEWQMLVTYEDILELDQEYVVDAGYTEFGGEYCLYAEYLSPLLGYTMRYYISIELGLVIGAEEYDETGSLVYTMSAGECLVGEINPASFTLPDGTVLIDIT